MQWNEEWLINNHISNHQEMLERYNKENNDCKTRKAFEAKVRRMGLYSRGKYHDWDDAWLINNTKDDIRYYSQLRGEYNKEHGSNVSANMFKQHMRSLGFECKRNYTEEEKEFLITNYGTTGNVTLEREFNKKFKRSLNINSTRPSFLDGLHKQEGSELESKRGTEIVIDGKRISKARYVLEQHGNEYNHRKSRIVHLDGDVNNNDIDNLAVIPTKWIDAMKDQLGVMFDDEKITRIAIEWCRNYYLLKENNINVDERGYERKRRSGRCQNE